MFHESTIAETLCLALVFAGFVFALLCLLSLRRPAADVRQSLTETKR